MDIMRCLSQKAGHTQKHNFNMVLLAQKKQLNLPQTKWKKI